MRVLAIGDIHGCSRALQYLLAAIGLRSSDLLVTVGDYVDRGPDAAGVIEKLRLLQTTRGLVSLRGNHEQLMLEARHGNDRFIEWLHSGGEQTLASYRLPAVPESLDRIPAAHWDFLENRCSDWHETPTHVFVHAGIDPDLPMNRQPEFILRWQRFLNPSPHSSGKTLICGHTAQKSGSPRNVGHAVCIDTGAAHGGWLTCYEATTGYVWQTTQSGSFRSGWLADFPNHAGVWVA